MNLRELLLTGAACILLTACGGGGGGGGQVTINTGGGAVDSAGSDAMTGNNQAAGTDVGTDGGGDGTTGNGGDTATGNVGNNSTGGGSDPMPNDGPPAAAFTVAELELRALDDNGEWTFGELYFDRTMPPFSYDAHIVADSRNANFTVAGLRWNGYVNLPETGDHAFRLIVNVGDMRPDSRGVWMLRCLSVGRIGDLELGDESEQLYFASTGGSKFTESFMTPNVSLQSGRQPFELSLQCRRTGSGNWTFTADLYDQITVDLQVLWPREVQFQPLPGVVFERDSVSQ